MVFEIQFTSAIPSSHLSFVGSYYSLPNIQAALKKILCNTMNVLGTNQENIINSVVIVKTQKLC